MNILITGGSKGLGAAIVKHLAGNAENHVYFTYANSVDAAKEITNAFKNTSALHCDFTNAESIAGLIAQIAAMDLSVLINNAFIAQSKEYFHKASADKFLSSFEVNVMPTIKISQAVITLFRKKKFGKIITLLSSANINKPPIGWSDYVANKNYLLSLHKSWATENIRFNITSNCISPSFMTTDFTSDTDPRIIEQMTEAHPLKKLLTVEEVANAVAFYCNCSQHINGTNLAINAGDDFL